MLDRPREAVGSGYWRRRWRLHPPTEVPDLADLVVTTARVSSQAAEKAVFRLFRPDLKRTTVPSFFHIYVLGPRRVVCCHIWSRISRMALPPSSCLMISCSQPKRLPLIIGAVISLKI